MQVGKKGGAIAEINVTPMADVIIVLLIIFMVITPLLTKGVTVDLVKTKNPIAMKEADKEDAILISIPRNGEIFLSPGNARVSLEELPGRISDLLTNRLDKTVYIRSDSRTKYLAVEDVVDALRAAGVDQLGLITEQLNPQSIGAVSGPKRSYAGP
jgi:biopolymer transport protein ExbD/biopolymer transport protein TolR